jgi:hypothetical protein
MGMMGPGIPTPQPHVEEMSDIVSDAGGDVGDIREVSVKASSKKGRKSSKKEISI